MHLLIGPQLKLRRAEKHLNAAKKRIDDFLESKPYTFVVEADPKPPDFIIVDQAFIIVAQARQLAPDDEVSVIIGDFAHNARSTLNLLTFQLSKLPIDNTRRFRLQFPIFDTRERYRNNVESYLAGLATEHIAIIEGFQPYNRVDGFDNDALGLLADINDGDKHRIIHGIGAVTSFRSLRFTGPGQLGSNIFIGPAAIRVGHGATINFGDGF